LRHTRSICALTLCVLLGGCADTRRDERGVYVVRPHDTVYSIAWRYGLDFRDLARWEQHRSRFPYRGRSDARPRTRRTCWSRRICWSRRTRRTRRTCCSRRICWSRRTRRTRAAAQGS